MPRSSSWSLALLLRREASITDGLLAVFCPAKYFTEKEKENQIFIDNKNQARIFFFFSIGKKLFQRIPSESILSRESFDSCLETKVCKTQNPQILGKIP